MLSVLGSDAAIDCRGDEVPSDMSPEDWELELVGLEEGPPVFSWSFSAFRLSTVTLETEVSVSDGNSDIYL